MEEKDAVVTTALMAYQGLKRNAYRFAGNYQINAVVSDNRETEVYTIEQAVADFFYLDCVLDQEALTFTDDLHQGFMLRYPEFTDIITFSSVFAQFFDTSYPGRVKKTRKRKAGAKNPISAFEGVRLKSDGALSEKALP